MMNMADICKEKRTYLPCAMRVVLVRDIVLPLIATVGTTQKQTTNQPIGSNGSLLARCLYSLLPELVI
jgi:hypothetical protein